MKTGYVALVGRANVGKSTLLNNILKQKVSITSPKRQTTRFPIQALYEDDRGQIVFIDTPGVVGKTQDALSEKLNNHTEDVLSSRPDIILYVVDYTKARDYEENRILGMVRKVMLPKILVRNKTDLERPDFSSEYSFYEDEFENRIEVSAFKRWNFNLLLDKIYELLPEKKEKLVDTTHLVQPGLNLDSKLFIAEIIREKVFLFTRDELPYMVSTQVDQIEERSNGTLYVKGKIITTADRYKKMLVGSSGFMIKKIGMAVRKELETASGKQVYTDLTVEVNPHWQDAL